MHKDVVYHNINFKIHREALNAGSRHPQREEKEIGLSLYKNTVLGSSEIDRRQIFKGPAHSKKGNLYS